MIRRLRRKLVGITTVLLMVMLIIILAFVHTATCAGLERSSMEALEAAASAALLRPDRPGSGDLDGRCFVLEQRPDGTFAAMGSSYFDLEDREMLLSLLERAQATGLRSGVLEDLQLRFFCAESSPGQKYAFMDISAENRTITQLWTTCILIFLLGSAGFWIISLLLARWAVRPVEQAWLQQRQFVADASHELKTPLTVIMTNAELLTDPEQPPENKSRFAQSILTMSQQMRGLVEALLEQARLDNGTAKTQWSRVDLSKLISDAVLPFEPMYFEAGRRLVTQVDPGLQVTGDEAHLRQVVEILLDNGCKYSTPGGTVLLCLRRYERSCLLSVTSPGEELTAQQRRDIFKRFYRLDAARKMDHSYGLGLSIAQSIVAQHKGKIWAQSENGHNTFFVTLPSN